MAASAATICIPNNLLGINLQDLLKLIGLPSEKERSLAAAKELSASANEVINTVQSVIDGLVLCTIEQHTRADFEKVRSAVFPSYFTAMRALGDLVKIVVPPQAIERIISESFCELEADFRQPGLSIGSDLSERAMFTVWTLRKINALSQEITAEPPNEDAGDACLARNYATHAVWTKFHIDCLVKSMRAQKPIYPEVVDPIRDGLRAAVNAYGWIRQWVDLHAARAEPELAQVPWDEEDEILLNDSMGDLARSSAR